MIGKERSMGFVSGIVVYTMIWWIVFFMVLPWGAHPEKNIRLGNASSAPKNPRLLLKFLVTTFLSTLLWAIVHFLITKKIIALEG